VACATCGVDCEQTVFTRPDESVSYFPSIPICDACAEIASKKAADERLAKELKEKGELQEDKWFSDCGIESFGLFGMKAFQGDDDPDGYDGFDRKRQPRAFDAMKNWKDPQSLILASPGIYGVGKTHLACALTMKLLDGCEKVMVVRGSVRRNPCPVFVTNEAKMLARIRKTFNRNNDEEDAESEDDVYRILTSPQLLIIDDVGKVRPRDLSFLQGAYYRIIDDRYTDGKAVILTTNLSLDELEQHIGGACADRMREMCGAEGIIVMTGKSYRRQR
jgi:DNA replication protein DnaC